MTELFKKKMLTYFNRIDFDGDGCITVNDFKDMASRFITEGHLEGDTAEELRTKVMELWGVYKSQAGDTDSITREAFLNTMTQINKGHLEAATKAPFAVFFQIVDTNHDNQIQLEEFKNFFKILKLKEADAETAFKNIDTNNDGLLSLEEFTTAGALFFTDEKDSPNSVFFGPLDN